LCYGGLYERLEVLGTYGYTGSALIPGWRRLSSYERHKRAAELGLNYAAASGNHLEVALHSDCEMHVRVLAVFDPENVSADRVIVVESLLTNFLQTLERGFVGTKMGSAAAVTRKWTAPIRAGWTR